MLTNNYCKYQIPYLEEEKRRKNHILFKFPMHIAQIINKNHLSYTLNVSVYVPPTTLCHVYDFFFFFKLELLYKEKK